MTRKNFTLTKVASFDNRFDTNLTLPYYEAETVCKKHISREVMTILA